MVISNPFRNLKLIEVPDSPHALGFLRLYVFGIWLIKLLVDPFEDLGYLPASIFNPVGLLKILPATTLEWLLDPQVLLSFRYLTILALLLATIGLFSRPATLISCFLLVAFQALIKGFSHLQHAEIPLLYAACIIALFPSGDAFALRPRRRLSRVPQNYSVPLLLIMILICFSYFEVGIYRIFNGGIRIFTEDSMKYWTVWYAFKDQDYAWNFSSWLYEYPVLALLFHVIVFVMMKIFFGELSLLYIVFLNPGHWFASLDQRLFARSRSEALPA
jgi:hypothetical protein